MLRIIEVGLVAWVVALVVILAVPALHEGDRDWWPWTCVAGFVLGAIGWVSVWRGRGSASAAAGAAPTTALTDPGTHEPPGYAGWFVRGRARSVGDGVVRAVRLL